MDPTKLRVITAPTNIVSADKLPDDISLTITDVLKVICPDLIPLPRSVDLYSFNDTILCNIIHCLEGENASCSSPLLTLISKYYKPGCDFDFQLPLGPNLQEFRFRNIGSSVARDKFISSKLCFHPNNVLKELDLADNPGLRITMNNVDIEGLHALERMNLNNIGFEMSNSSLLDDFPRLIELHIAGNRLQFKGNESIFKYNGKLEQLDLSNSIAGRIPPYEFSHLNKLQTLNLSHNSLQDLNVQVSNLTSLRILGH